MEQCLSYNLNLDIYGHRGGVIELVPEHTILSYTLGAQEGADYLEPDLVLSKDGELIVLHDLELSKTTDIASHPEFANRSKTMTVWKRGNPKNSTNGQPQGIVNKYENQTGWFVFDFTVHELKRLKKISGKHPTDSPLNGIYDILTFNESLEITKNLSTILNRNIGIIPETKHPEWFKNIMGFNHFEYKILESLNKYGFIYFDDNDGYYKPYYFEDNKSSVIIQSFTAESLFKFNEYSNNQIPTMFLMEWYDEYELNIIEWIAKFADYIACSKTRVEELVDIRNEFNENIKIGTYTLSDDINEYIKFINYDLNGIFSNDVGSGRVIKQLLQELINDVNGNSTLSAFCDNLNNDDGDNDDIIKIEIKWAFIGGCIALICGLLIGVFAFYIWYRYKLSVNISHQRLADD